LGISAIDFTAVFLTQSQNSSAKMALCVDEFSCNFIEFGEKRNHDWNQLEDVVLYTTYEVFMFHNFAFYFRMLKNVIDNLIPTGIMNHLIETHYTRKWKFEKFEDGPKVLSLDDLIFGFNIWLGCCLISFISFILEQVLRIFKKQPRVIKFAKVHPLECRENITRADSNTEQQTTSRRIEVIADIHCCDSSEDNVSTS